MGFGTRTTVLRPGRQVSLRLPWVVAPQPRRFSAEVKVRAARMSFDAADRWRPSFAREANRQFGNDLEAILRIVRAPVKSAIKAKSAVKAKPPTSKGGPAASGALSQAKVDDLLAQAQVIL